MKTSGDRLRALLRECHLSATDFAANRKVTPQHVNNWFKRGIPMARLEEVAELLTVNARWLRTGEGPKHPTESANENNGGDTPISLHPGRRLSRGEVDVPVFKEIEPTQDGEQSVIAPIPGKKVRLPLHVLHSMNINTSNAICLAMSGNSMADKIQDGSLLGIDRGLTRVIDGEMYAIEHSGMLRIKYLYRLPGGGLRLRSHNHSEYPDEAFTAQQIEQQQIRVLGWIFWWSTLNTRRQRMPLR
jgi:phage repressor protein C with HTH and peptisase S24 domain